MSQLSFTPIDFNPFEQEREIDKIVLTNEPQKEIWLSCVIGGNDSSLAYNESVSLDFKGIFYPAYLTEAMEEVISRHEALRATISANGETLIVYKHIASIVPITDISKETDQKAILDQFIADQMLQLFDLQEGPLFRCFLHQLSDGHYFFTIVKHHIISDGWSTGIILEDLSKIYNAKVKGTVPALQDAPQISQYAEEMASFEQTPDYQQTKNYWKNMYQDSVPVLDLPTDFPRPEMRTYKADRLDHHLSLELVGQLKKMGAKQGCSLVNTLLSAFEVFLYLQTSQRDIVVGLPAAGQAATGNFGLVGHCVNLLPIRSIIDPNISFGSYLKNRKGSFFDAYDNQKFTFGELIKSLNMKRDHSRIPLVPVIFNIDMGMDNAVSFDNLTFKLISNPRAYETFEIFLNATGSTSSFVLEWSYNTQLFKSATIEKMAAAFELLLHTLAADPSVTLKELSRKNTESWSAQLEQWNDTAVSYPKNSHLSVLIDQTASNYPDKTAVVFRNETVTYKRLVERSNQLASCLVEKGIKVGDIVGLSTDRSMEMIVCLLGILKAGAVYIPLDPEYPQERIEYMLSDSNAKLLLLSKAYSGKFQSNAAEMVIEDIWPDLDSYPANTPPVAIKGNDLAYILYTSGSTGKPKGVKIMHYNLINFLLSMQSQPGITAEDRLLAITTISFDIAGLELYLPLITGAELILCDKETARDGRLLLDLIEKKNISFMQATPSTWRMMIDSGWNKKYPIKVLCGGEALPKELAAELAERSEELWNMYGPTETTIWSTLKHLKKDDGPVTIGRPINNTQIYLLDEENELAAPGATGEIFIGGDGLSPGYLNQPALTEDRFINHPFSEDPLLKLYKTGDLGKFTENGEILCLGRIDQQVKIRGYRIELGEIETLLSEQAEIKQAVVIAREDTPGNKKLVGYVTLSEAEARDISPSWKDRWDTIYDMAAKSSENQELSSRKLDGVLLEQWQNSEKLIEESAEWLKVSAERIKKFKAPHILEIGSGGGQLLFEIAPYAQSYTATDYAETAIEKLKEKLNAQPEQWKHVTARANSADDFSSLSGTEFDLIVIHSVAQYFPDAAYFLKVIEESVKRITEGGCLFIGDMQGKNSLEMYHATDYLSHAKNETSRLEFQEIVQNRVRIEDEFIADPAFFYLLPGLIPAITGVDVQLRQGKSQNETTKYHYDVWIYVNSKHEVLKPELSLKWEEISSLENLAGQLKHNGLATVEVKGIFNERTATDYALLQWMNAAGDSSVAQIKKDLEQAKQGIHPDLFWQLGEELAYHTHVRWTTDGTDGLFDVVFVAQQYDLILPESASPALLIHSKPGDFAKNPLSTNEVYLSKSITDRWKSTLYQQLPDYMVPADFVALKSFPLTPNHKIDKKALPKPQSKAGTGGNAVHLPRNADEVLIASIWSAVLEMDDIDTDDDFFELGGHSLLAVKVMAAIEKETGKRLPLATLFENSTIEKLAKKLASDQEEQWNALVPIKTGGTKDPIFLVHGGGLNILLFKAISKYMDEDQPVYGLQALGLNQPTQLLYTIEEIAAAYISEILIVHPDGPYCLAGYSLGGFIAYEMARQLIEMGKTVKFLGILDTYAGNQQVSGIATSAKLSKKVKRQFHKIPFFTRSFLKNPKEAVGYQYYALKYKLDNIFSKEIPSYTEHFTPYEKEIYRSYDIAHLSYTLTPAEIKITLFNVKKRLYYLDDLVHLGWDVLAKKGIDTHIVPGDHKTFLYPPNDKEFAEILQAALNNI